MLKVSEMWRFSKNLLELHTECNKANLCYEIFGLFPATGAANAFKECFHISLNVMGQSFSVRFPRALPHSFVPMQFPNHNVVTKLWRKEKAELLVFTLKYLSM